MSLVVIMELTGSVRRSWTRLGSFGELGSRADSGSTIHSQQTRRPIDGSQRDEDLSWPLKAKDPRGTSDIGLRHND